MGDGGRDVRRAQGPALQLQESEGLDADERLRARQRGGRGLGVPGPVPVGRRRRPGQDQVGAGGQSEPGGIQGGSGGQYFVGDFDGTRFSADDSGAYTPPAGDVYANFEGADYGAWTTTGTAFGSGPARGTLPGQQTVTGFNGGGLVNSFIDFDGSQGTLTSPAFTITRDYVNLLVAGGAHVHQPGAGDGTPPAGRVLGDFEAPTYGAWTTTGTSPAPPRTSAATAVKANGSSTRSSARAKTATATGARSSHPSSSSTRTTSASLSPAAHSRRPRSGCWLTAPSCAPPRVTRAGT